MKQHILIVEDDRWQAEVYRDVLSPEFDVEVCHNAQDAIEAVDQKQPNLIVLDMIMPGGNGAAFLQELRTYDDLMQVPVVICSSVHMTPGQRQALAQFAPIALLDKADITPERLTKLVKEQLHARAK